MSNIAEDTRDDLEKNAVVAAAAGNVEADAQSLPVDSEEGGEDPPPDNSPSKNNSGANG